MKILILALFSVLGSQLYSQGNLQFNQVISGSGILATSGASANQTVPAGKVWKIESVSGWHSGDYGSRLGLTINNVTVNIPGNVIFPIWIKAGDVFRLTVLSNPGTGSPLGPMNYIYSIIEFNVIP